ncbi:MAG: enolase C-terminal domain-like protein [Porticoccaceae bacterium]|nr:enolase C-terminal domain-like protein [Porticoccaceae bacterium]MDG2501563.1 enolase C-terminal domain-like protein [Porticoccaceae bacterium]
MTNFEPEITLSEGNFTHQKEHLVVVIKRIKNAYHEIINPTEGTTLKITDVKITIWNWKDIPPVQYLRDFKADKAHNSQMGLVRILTDEGIEGHAFLGSAYSPIGRDGATLVERYKPLLVGRDPFDRELIWQKMARWASGGSMRVIGAVDVALWDLAGKAAGVPVHKIMGTFRESAPAYASSQILGSAEEYVEYALKYKEAGWHAYKMHPPGIAAEDISICKAVREAVGDDFRLMLDSTWSYDYPDALRVGQVIEELGFYWFEDPLKWDDIYGYEKLKQVLKIPLMATELPANGPTTYAPWLLHRATDYLRGDPALKGGLTSCLKTAHTAETFQMNYEIHHGGNSLNNVANLNLLMALPNSELFEVLLPDTAQKHGLIEDIKVDKHGMVHAPTSPGLGYEIDFDLIEHNKVTDI